MPLIVMCGLPCSGKTTRATQLASILELHIQQHNVQVQQLRLNPIKHKKPPTLITYNPKVIIINEESLLTVRGEMYKDANEEKKLRGALLSAVERWLDRETVVVLDSMNYIKGFRYQLHCISKAARTTHCIYFCMASPETSRLYNTQRASTSQDSYPPKSSNPSSPLPTHLPDPRHAPPSPNLINPDTPIPPTLTPNQSTKSRPVAEAGYLEGLDGAVKSVADGVMSAVREGRCGECVVEAAGGLIKVVVPTRGVSVSEMGRLRRRFLVSLNRLDSDLTKEEVAKGFGEFLELNLK
ncbi:chromatin associated protein KTI12-domain-containing protein [Chytridium lagenaria]|nr:chromatin associated protein KTI12-domain-containing protein [Chytridium lagenaria]